MHELSQCLRNLHKSYLHRCFLFIWITLIRNVFQSYNASRFQKVSLSFLIFQKLSNGTNYPHKINYFAFEFRVALCFFFLSHFSVCSFVASVQFSRFYRIYSFCIYLFSSLTLTRSSLYYFSAVLCGEFLILFFSSRFYSFNWFLFSQRNYLLFFIASKLFPLFARLVLY